MESIVGGPFQTFLPQTPHQRWALPVVAPRYPPPCPRLRHRQISIVDRPRLIKIEQEIRWRDRRRDVSGFDRANVRRTELAAAVDIPLQESERHVGIAETYRRRL